MAPGSIGAKAKAKAISLERTTLMSVGGPLPSESESENSFHSVWVLLTLTGAHVACNGTAVDFCNWNGKEQHFQETYLNI